MVRPPPVEKKVRALSDNISDWPDFTVVWVDSEPSESVMEVSIEVSGSCSERFLPETIRLCFCMRIFIVASLKAVPCAQFRFRPLQCSVLSCLQFFVVSLGLIAMISCVPTPQLDYLSTFQSLKTSCVPQ